MRAATLKLSRDFWLAQAVRDLSPQARDALISLMVYAMHSPRPGHLLATDGSPRSTAQLAQTIGCDLDAAHRFISEMRGADLAREEHGVLVFPYVREQSEDRDKAAARMKKARLRPPLRDEFAPLLRESSRDVAPDVPPVVRPDVRPVVAPSVRSENSSPRQNTKTKTITTHVLDKTPNGRVHAENLDGDGRKAVRAALERKGVRPPTLDTLAALPDLTVSEVEGAFEAAESDERVRNPVGAVIWRLLDARNMAPEAMARAAPEYAKAISEISKLQRQRARGGR